MSTGGHRYLQAGLVGALAIIITVAVFASALGVPGGTTFPGTQEQAANSPTPTATAPPDPSPTPTPAPTQPPTPAVLDSCYGERPAQDEGVVLLPARERSIFRGCQVVAFYGYPSIPQMGALGVGDREAMLASLQEQVAAYEATNGGRTVVPALHLIAAVAQRAPGPDGTYLARMDDEMLDDWIGFAEEHDLIVILDLQMGMSTVEEEISHVIEYLRDPRVHLALDPEWAMRGRGQAPGEVVGNMEASELNTAQEMLQGLVDEHNLDNRVLMVHQFQEQMIQNKEQLETFPGVDLVIHTDGFGTRSNKIAAYQMYVADDGAPHSGFKLFFDWDVDFMGPEDVNGLQPQPDIVTFQ